MTLPKAQKNRLVAWVPRWPTYVSETPFAQTIIEQVAGAGTGPTPLDQFSAGLRSLSPTTFTGTLQILYDNALRVGDTPAEQGAALQRNLEGGFHEFGERLTGWYKRDNRKHLFLVGLLVAVLADVDSVRLAAHDLCFDAGSALLVRYPVPVCECSQRRPQIKPKSTT